MSRSHKAIKQFATICAESSKETRTSSPNQLPIYATAGFSFENLEEGMEIFLNQPGSHVYSRYGNPTVEAVAQKIADLEMFGLDRQGYGLLSSSGMSAIHLAIQSLLQPGNAILTQTILYGGTTELMEKVFRKNGVDIFYDNLVDAKNIESILNKNPHIKIIFIETPVNPTLNCVDISMVSKIAKAYKIKLVADNTFATPYLTQAIKFGADVVVHSTTKYLHGHGASTGGAIICANKKLMYEKIWMNYKLVGSNASPFEAWLVDLGLKTLPLRMQQHCSNALKLAQWFEAQPMIQKVNYPGLKSHPFYPIAKKQMKLFGAMMSIEIKANLKTVQKILNKLKICAMVPSLGETGTIILHPASMSHLKTPKEIREAQGIKDNLVRISVGIENVEDIIEDWKQALGK